MSKSMVAIITAVITAVVSVCSTLVVVKYTDGNGEQKEAQVEIFYDDENGGNDDGGYEIYELSGGQQTATGDTSRFNVEIKSAQMARDYEGDECVVITYIFTNSDSKARNFDLACNDAVYQNGVALESTSSNSEDSFYFDGWNYNDVQPGASYEFCIGYKISDKTADLEVVVTNDHIGPSFTVSRTFYLS